MRIRRLTVVLPACVLAGWLGAAASASARTQGFYVYNLTGSASWRVTAVYQSFGDNGFDQPFETGPTAPPPPRVGDVLVPGVDPEHSHIEIVVPLFRRGVVVKYHDDVSGRNVEVDFNMSNFANGVVCHTPRGDVLPTGSPACAAEGKTVKLFGPPVSDTVAGADKVRQAEVLGNRVCVARNVSAALADCRFDPATDVRALSQPHLVGNVEVNCGNSARSISSTFEDRQSASNSTGLTFGASRDGDYIFERAGFVIQSKYPRPWTTQYRFHGEAQYVLPPGDAGFVSARTPVFRDTGTFLIQIGFTEFRLEDVYFETPDPSGKPEFTVRTEPMTAEQRKQACPSPQSHRAPASFASIRRVGTRTGDTLVGGRESTTLRGLAGNDILLGEAGNDLLGGGSGRDALFGGAGNDRLQGGPGNDRLYGGSGNDLLEGGPGNDRLYGGSGSDRIVDSGGRTYVNTGTAGRSPDWVDVRDGKGDDTVVCGSRRVLVIADKTDHLRHCPSHG